jgi:hypothetical protein
LTDDLHGWRFTTCGESRNEPIGTYCLSGLLVFRPLAENTDRLE